MARNKKIKKAKIDDIHYAAQGGPAHGGSFRFDPTKAGDIPLIIPYETHGGVYVFHNNVYIWKSED